jgi:sugar lactone lactonase YvrE
MKTTKIKFHRSITQGACAGAVLFMAAGASAQNLFVADYSTGDVYEIAPGGTQSTFASGLANPNGIAFNSSGDLFVGSSDNNVGAPSGYITEFTPSGTPSTFASGVDAQGLAINSANNLFQADYRSGNIYEYAPNGAKSTFATGLNLPIALAFNSAGDLFVGNTGNGSITEITPGGTPSVFATGLNDPQAFAFNSAGNLFEADQGSGNIYEFSTTGSRSLFASVSSPNGLAFDSAGDLYVSSGTGPITEIHLNGSQTTFATEPGIPDVMAFQPVPEPSVLGLMGASAVVFMLYRRAGKSMPEKA